MKPPTKQAGKPIGGHLVSVSLPGLLWTWLRLQRGGHGPEGEDSAQTLARTPPPPSGWGGQGWATARETRRTGWAAWPPYCLSMGHPQVGGPPGPSSLAPRQLLSPSSEPLGRPRVAERSSPCLCHGATPKSPRAPWSLGAVGDTQSCPQWGPSMRPAIASFIALRACSKVN